jgi:hypothetical protein
MSDKRPSRGYFASALTCRCPRCRDGKMFKYPTTFRFKRNMDMNKTCPVCDQPMEIEVGFYYGTSYVSYALTVALSVASLVAWWVLIGFSTTDNRFIYWLITNAVFLFFLQPWLMRLSRSIWLSWFVHYDPDWRDHKPEDVSERMNADQANNW